ncbi:lysophospholipid acyltransferase family protein [Oleisolibacter albus]|uniref:lysophospholipid acyltransferase family protein n=1 Tax=Oleisolibacter albus TaxID=2171757 RepID=UPI000DF2D8B8|nr:lysophospholipid acyltransferase family protein [Oleisolibacter albus]
MEGLPDPQRLHSPALVRFFGRVMARQMAARFHAVRVARPGLPELPAGVPVLVYCNHPSWWDAALLILLATRFYPGRRSFGPMDAEALRQYGFMRRIGLFPVAPGTAAGAVAFLKVGQQLLERPDTMLWVTGEGAFTDPRRRPLCLRPGIAHLLVRLPRVIALPLAIEYPFWSEKTPEALCRFGAPIDTALMDGTSPAALHRLLEQRLETTLDALALAAQARDPGAFIRLLRGRAGVGGVYDVWRRLRAWRRGEPFAAEHGAMAGEGRR